MSTGFAFRVFSRNAWYSGKSTLVKKAYSLDDLSATDFDIYGYDIASKATANYSMRNWEAGTSGNDRHYSMPIATMVYPYGSSGAVRVVHIMEGGTKHYVASPPEHPSAPWWEYDTPWLESYVISITGPGSMSVSGPAVSSLGGISMALFGESDCHLGQVIGAPSTCYAGKTPLDNAMFHDDDYIYSLYATGPTKAYGLLNWDTGDVSTPLIPATCYEQYAWPELTHVGDGRYILIVRKYTGSRKTLGVYLGSPWVGWETVSPDAVKGSPLEPINVSGEYLHAEPVFYDYATGECQLEAVIKDLSQATTTYRFAKYNRKDFTDKRWRLIGKVHNIPDTGDLSFSLTSYSKGSFAARRMRLPNMYSAFMDTRSASLGGLVPTWARFANEVSGALTPVYTVSATR